MSRIVVRGLRRTFAGRPPVEALRGVDLVVEEGTLTAVLGPSGCGKTTLLRALAGMERPDAGAIEVGGRALDGPAGHTPPERRAIGLVPQEGALFPHLDVGGNVAFGLQRQPRAERERRVDELLELVGLPGLARRRPHELSGGQQQRVALARALAPRPAVLLLDEPFSALDTGLRASVREDVAAVLRATATTAVLVTHDQSEAMTMADVVAVMRAGRIEQSGPPSGVYQRPVSEWVGRFLGDAVAVPGRRIDGHRAASPLGELVLAPGVDHYPGPEVTLFCRPEQLRPAVPGSGVIAVVDRVRFHGPDATVGLDVGEHRVQGRWPTSALPAVGDAVAVEVVGTVLAFPPLPPPD